MKKVQIKNFASYTPELTVSNDDLSQIMDTSDEWIKSRTGISNRKISLNENTSDLCLKVAQKLIQKNNINVNDIGLIIVATMSPDACTPSTSAIVQGKLNAKNAMAFDISAACSGFIYGLEIAQKMMRQSSFKYSIVIGGEVLSKEVDWTDRTCAVLFGDGAAGALLENDAQVESFYEADVKTFGELGDRLVAGQTDPIQAFPPKEFTKFHPFEMDGRAVYKFATSEVPQSMMRASETNQIDFDKIDYFVLHQANYKIIKSIAKKIKQPLDKFPMDMDKYGNTSAASIPLMLADLQENNKLHEGQLLMLAGFGGGLTIGSQIIKL
ncbi:beta-ketoacyl-ACP synthase III [Ligilactobacillus cholophilus]|uniref:beta-ketoacyl-ACP synthase III n=1 Tax=Ligilactobacillus cholophilus TaxID=3050131 RepID=UPI0025B0FB1D|nr:beta-ketoacyl-ACP synthase III [Ligilactobacillus cholophilus]